MTYQKAMTDATTGKTVMVDLTPAEVAEIEAKVNAAKVASENQAVLDSAAQTEAAVDLQVITERPTNDDIKNAKNIAHLQDLLLKQNAVIAVLIKRAGLERSSCT